MKVLLINTVSGYGSTGRLTVDIARALQERGDKAFIAYGQGYTDFDHAFKVGGRLENHLHNIGSRFLGKQGYFSKSGTLDLVNYIETVEPDVIHLGNLHGNYLNLRILFEYLSSNNVPVVWSLHDCWPFTGKCVYYTETGCYKWQTHCDQCPQVKKYPPSLFLDQSKRMYDDKRKWFTSVKKMSIVPVSNWLAGEVRKSFLNVYPIYPVYNWIDQNVFFPRGVSVRSKYGIPENKFVVLGVSAGWTKRNNRLEDFLRLSDMVSDEMQMVMVGKKDPSARIPSKIIHISYVEDTKDLALLYSMADVYVHLSVEDTFGMVIAEALACGTPAIVYDATACPEVVGAQCGCIVRKRDISAVHEALCKLKRTGKDEYSERCVNRVGRKFNFIENTNKIISLYERALTV